MNVTLSIDEKLLARARELAHERGTSVNQLIRDYSSTRRTWTPGRSATRPGRCSDRSFPPVPPSSLFRSCRSSSRWQPAPLGLPPEAARARVEALSRLEVVAPRVEDLLAAIDLHRLHSLSIWDALVVRAALVSACRVLYTEDLQHGRRFEALEVVNPFL